VCARTRVRTCALLCLHAFVCACERVLPFRRQGIFAHVCVCACAWRRRAVLIARPAAPGGRACAVAVRCDRLKVSRASAAGVTWTSRTTSAPWDPRHSHTSVVDAAGAIYVIGGYGGNGGQDVWVSTDGGAWAELGQGWSGGRLVGAQG
jgi:hypothetical protein